MMDMVMTFDDILDKCIDRRLSVERLEEWLRYHPEQAGGVERLLQAILALSLCATLASSTQTEECLRRDPGQAGGLEHLLQAILALSLCAALASSASSA